MVPAAVYIAIRTAIVPQTVHVEIEFEIPIELLQLALKVITYDQDAPVTEHFALRHASVARKQPAVFADRPLDQRLISAV
jgi:hypothetical protein